MRIDSTGQAATGLDQYIHAVAESLGDETVMVDCDADPELATAIVLVTSRIPTLDQHTLLLSWDEVNGWALRIELDDDGDTTALAYLGEIVAAPRTVRRFLAEALEDRHPGTPFPPGLRNPNQHDDLEQRLAAFL